MHSNQIAGVPPLEGNSELRFRHTQGCSEEDDAKHRRETSWRAAQDPAFAQTAVTAQGGPLQAILQRHK